MTLSGLSHLLPAPTSFLQVVAMLLVLLALLAFTLCIWAKERDLLLRIGTLFASVARNARAWSVFRVGERCFSGGLLLAAAAGPAHSGLMANSGPMAKRPYGKYATGVWVKELPVTPERIRAALRAAKS